MGKHKGNYNVKFRYLIAPKEEDFVSHDIMNYTKQMEIFSKGTIAAEAEVGKQTLSNFDIFKNNEEVHQAYWNHISDRANSNA